MLGDTLALHDGLAATRRFPFTSRASVARWEIAALVSIGAATALMTSYVKLNLGIPGHVIVLTVLPFAFGLALVPRRFAGTIMGGSALATMLLSGHTGLGAISSMVATGVFLDLALRKAKGGLPLYVAFVAAGLGGNTVAFAARAATKLTGLDAGAVGFGSWWAHSLLTYALCGALAGLVSVVAWFHVRERRRAG
jgi:hypothetical protein